MGYSLVSCDENTLINLKLEYKQIPLLALYDSLHMIPGGMFDYGHFSVIRILVNIQIPLIWQTRCHPILFLMVTLRCTILEPIPQLFVEFLPILIEFVEVKFFLPKIWSCKLVKLSIQIAITILQPGKLWPSLLCRHIRYLVIWWWGIVFLFFFDDNEDK